MNDKKKIQEPSKEHLKLSKPWNPKDITQQKKSKDIGPKIRKPLHKNFTSWMNKVIEQAIEQKQVCWK
jgi:hypothetical protein